MPSSASTRTEAEFEITSEDPDRDDQWGPAGVDSGDP
jgi:hypothetical protein